MKNKIITCILSVLLIVSAGLIMNNTPSYAEDSTTYYISNDGDDSNQGSSMETPWKTLDKVNHFTFKPGDHILLKSGDVWYENLILTSSGTNNLPIVYGHYGEGEKPQILGSQSLKSWTQVENNIWKSNDSVSDPSYGVSHDGTQKNSQHKWPGGAWFVALDGTTSWGNQESYITNGEFSNLKKVLDWGWYNDNIYIYSLTDPNNTIDTMQVSQRQYGIGMENHQVVEHIIIDGIDVLYCQSKGFSSGYPAYEASGLTIKNSHIAYIGIKESPSAHGVALFHSDVLLENNEIHDTGRHGVFFAAYNKNNFIIENVTFKGNHFYNGFHTTGLDIQNPGAHTYRNFVIEDNHFEGSPNHDLNGEEYVNTNLNYINNSKQGTFEDFYFFNNLFTYSTGKGLSLSGINNSYIYNNTFYGVNPSLSNYQGQLYFSGDIKNAFVKNNIFYNDVDTSYNRYFISMKMDKKHLTEVHTDNNLFYATDPAGYIVGIADVKHYKMADWQAYQETMGESNHGLNPTDPLFNNANIGDFGLQITSPAKDKAIELKEYSRSDMDLGANVLGSQNTSVIKLMLNGQYITGDVDPMIESGRTLVPFRFIFEAFGLDVSWDGELRAVTGTNDAFNIQLKIDETTVNVNGEPIELDVPARIINGRTMVPIRFIGEVLGMKVDWDRKTRTVILTE